MAPSSFSSANVESNWLKRQSDRQIIILVDPYSTGCVVAQEFRKRGYLIIAIWTIGFAEAMKKHVPRSCGKMEYFAEIDELDTHEATFSKLREVAKGHEVVSCLAGGEAGVVLADAFSEYLSLIDHEKPNPTRKILSNGTSIPNRKDKFIQQELCRRAGLRSIRQSGSDKFENVGEFLRTESYPVVLKPTESAGKFLNTI